MYRQFLFWLASNFLVKNWKWTLPEIKSQSESYERQLREDYLKDLTSGISLSGLGVLVMKLKQGRNQFGSMQNMLERAQIVISGKVQSDYRPEPQKRIRLTIEKDGQTHNYRVLNRSANSKLWQEILDFKFCNLKEAVRSGKIEIRQGHVSPATYTEEEIRELSVS